MKVAYVLMAIAAPVAVTGCSPTQKAAPLSQSSNTLTVSGGLYYRERIALPPGAVAEVTVEDVSRADAPSTVLARQVIPLSDRQLPVNFELKIDRSKLEPRMRYSVRGKVRSAEGRLLWTTDTMHPVDPLASISEQGLLQLVQVPAS